MPNVHRKTAQDREAKAYALFQSGFLFEEVQQTLYQIHGYRMNINRLCQVRAAAAANIEIPPRPKKEKTA